MKKQRIFIWRIEKRRPDKPKIKELIAQPEQFRTHASYNQISGLNSPAKENLEMTSQTSHDNSYASTQVISSRTIDSNDFVKSFIYNKNNNNNKR